MDVFREVEIVECLVEDIERRGPLHDGMLVCGHIEHHFAGKPPALGSPSAAGDFFPERAVACGDSVIQNHEAAAAMRKFHDSCLSFGRQYGMFLLKKDQYVCGIQRERRAEPRFSGAGSGCTDVGGER